MSSLPKKSPGRPRDEGLWVRRQDEILDAAVKVFAERGYPNTDLQVVADVLGISKGTVYRYFPSKEELFLAAVDRGMRQLTEQAAAGLRADADPLEQLAASLRGYLAFFEANPEYVELIIQERAAFRDRKVPTYFVHRDKNIGPWHDLLRSLIASGRVRGVPIERLTDVMCDVGYGTIFTNYFTGRRRSLEEQAQDILDIVFNGILTDAERRRRGGH